MMLGLWIRAEDSRDGEMEIKKVKDKCCLVQTQFPLAFFLHNTPTGVTGIWIA